MSLTIYHNPRCSKSRQTLQIIADSGSEHRVVNYLQDAPSAATIIELAKRLGVAVEDLLRRGEATFKDASDLPSLQDDQALAEWLAAHPIVLQRPIVVNESIDSESIDNKSKGSAIIGRPPENVRVLLS